MSNNWESTILTSVEQALDEFTELRGKRWMSRGQSKCYDSLVPSIDRAPRLDLSRLEKLKLERQSIDLFRSTTRFLTEPGEQGALADDIVALMVLRHYEVPTRLLDWLGSPFVAAYFAAESPDEEDGEIWTFDEPLYEQKGKAQWRQRPETTSDGSGDPSKFDAKLTAFSLKEPHPWFICAFYSPGFPRQNAQLGAYSMTSGFGRDHADAIANLLEDPSHYHLFVVKAWLKPALRKTLHETYGIWRGSLFPDSAGAAGTARRVVFPE